MVDVNIIALFPPSSDMLISRSIGNPRPMLFFLILGPFWWVGPRRPRNDDDITTRIGDGAYRVYVYSPNAVDVRCVFDHWGGEQPKATLDRFCKSRSAPVVVFRDALVLLRRLTHAPGGCTLHPPPQPPPPPPAPAI